MCIDFFFSVALFALTNLKQLCLLKKKGKRTEQAFLHCCLQRYVKYVLSSIPLSLCFPVDLLSVPFTIKQSILQMKFKTIMKVL